MGQGFFLAVSLCTVIRILRSKIGRHDMLKLFATPIHCVQHSVSNNLYICVQHMRYSILYIISVKMLKSHFRRKINFFLNYSGLCCCLIFSGTPLNRVELKNSTFRNFSHLQKVFFLYIKTASLKSSIFIIAIIIFLNSVNFRARCAWVVPSSNTQSMNSPL